MKRTRVTQPRKNAKYGVHAFKPELAAQILDIIAEEGVGLKTACDRLGVYRRTVRNWSYNIPEFAEMLAKARREALEGWADDIIDIGNQVAGSNDNAVVQAARLRVDTRKWLMAKLRPDVYGDRVQLTGRDGRDLIPQNTEAQIPRLMQVLAVLLPGTANSELHSLATIMAGKLTALPSPQSVSNGSEQDEEEPETLPPGWRPNDRPN